MKRFILKSILVLFVLGITFVGGFGVGTYCGFRGADYYRQYQNIISNGQFQQVLQIAQTAYAESGNSTKPVNTLKYTVVNVHDGDTVTLKNAVGNKVKVRLYGIDAPETPSVGGGGQPYWKESREFLKKYAVQGKVIYLQEMAKSDRYGRVVGMLWIKGNVNPNVDISVNEKMVGYGMAEAYVEYLDDPIYKDRFIRAEYDARVNKRGIWSNPNYERPSEFRKRIKKGR